MVSDVPVGVLLSGGLDSSIIVGLLAELGQRDLQTFSVGFEEVGGIGGDEFRYSDLIAEHYGTNHHKLRVSNEEMLPALEGAIEAHPGSFVHLPMGVVHSFRNIGGVPARFLTLVVPAGLEGFFEEVGRVRARPPRRRSRTSTESWL